MLLIPTFFARELIVKASYLSLAEIFIHGRVLKTPLYFKDSTLNNALAIF
jgi:hypothetical protein